MRIYLNAAGDNFQMELFAPKDAPIQVHVHHHYPNRGGNKPTQSEEALLRGQQLMFGYLESLRKKLVPLTDKVAANETLLKDLSSRLREAIDLESNPEAVAILDALDANTNNLARAAAENTVQASTPPSEPIADDPLTEWDESKGETGPKPQT